MLVKEILKLLKINSSIPINVNSSYYCKNLFRYKVNPVRPKEVAQVVLIQISFVMNVNGTEG